jgi:small subunit ribosomal protein S16
MLKICLVPIGKKGQRSYQIRVKDSRSPRDSGKYLDVLGYLNRIRNEYKLDKEKYKRWVGQGAQPVEVVKKLYNNDKEN